MSRSVTEITSDATCRRSILSPTLVSTMFHQRRQTVRRLATVGSLALLLSACAEDKPLNTFETAGPQADRINDLANPLWFVMAFVFLFVVGGGIGLAIKNRVKPEDFDPDDLPEQIHGNARLEWGWTAIPAVLLAIIAVPTWITIWKLEERNVEPAGAAGEQCALNEDGARSGDLDVMVIGQQWWWEYRYDLDCDGFFEDVNGDGVVDDIDAEWPLEIALDDDDLVVANQLVFPAGQQIDLTITSRDVIHSFWIPRLNGKRDAVPGRIHTWSLEAYEPGEYNGWCTEYCGLSHARMRMSAVALSEEDFALWVENQVRPADIPSATGSEEEQLAANGRALFQAVCTSCHIINEDPNDADGEAYNYGKDFEAALAAKAAPNLTHFATRSVFAGAIYSQYAGVDPDDDDLFDVIADDPEITDYLEIADEDGLRFNEAALKRWISNAPSQKAMNPDNLLGMPAFPALTEPDLEALVAYLATLD